MAERLREGVDVAPAPLRLALGSQALARLLAGPAMRALHATVALVVIGVVITHALLDSAVAPTALMGGWREMAASGDASQHDDEQDYVALAGALAAVDRGMLALSLTNAALGSAERLERARAARDAFSDALERLDDQEVRVRTSMPLAPLAWRGATRL